MGPVICDLAITRLFTLKMSRSYIVLCIRQSTFSLIEITRYYGMVHMDDNTLLPLPPPPPYDNYKYVFIIVL